MKWQVESVLESISDLDFSSKNMLNTDDLKAYESFYNLDFHKDLAHVTHLMGYMHVTPFKLVAHVFDQPNSKGTVYLQHGYYDHVGLYKHVIRDWLAQGYSVFSYDLPGHGLSSGDRANIESFDQYDDVFCEGLTLVKKHLPSPIIAVGQSTGGAIISNYLLTRGINTATNPFERIYLLAPLVRPVDWLSSKLFYYSVRPFINKMKRTFAQNSNDSEFLKFLSTEDVLQPLALKVNWVGALNKWIKKIESCAPTDIEVYIVQGTDDGTVDYKHNIKILNKKFEKCHVKYIEGGRHQLVNESLSKREKVIQCLTPLL